MDQPGASPTTGTARQRYSQLEMARTPYLDRARDAAELTIPALVPRQEHSSHTTLDTPFQGLGARGVNNLASKLLLALLPPNSPFFRLVIDDYTLKELTQQEGMRAEIERGLNRVERSVQAEIETMALRVDVFEALKHLLVAGNILIYIPMKGNARLFHLNRYVVKRDPSGNVLEGITKEVVAPDVLPEAIRG
ncbi:MAG: phage tail protein, partial [Gammaproteobacteria bacterium]|nr:phage tail protein [Gammaproteobacteria bacterium]